MFQDLYSTCYVILHQPIDRGVATDFYWGGRILSDEITHTHGRIYTYTLECSSFHWCLLK